MVPWNLPPEVVEWMALLSLALHARAAWRLRRVFLGIFFAHGRRTVASWLRAAQIGPCFASYYYFISRVGRKAEAVATALVRLLVAQIPCGEELLCGLDDSPTQRYGPKVQGAGIHHHPTPGPTDQKFLYGHIWVTLAWLVRHPCWGSIGLPLWAKLYVRQKDVAQIPPRYGWKFHTKLELAAELVEWMAALLRPLGKRLRVVVDGFYGKKPFLKRARSAGVVVQGRLRKDARLWSVPTALRPGQRRGPGRPRIYGPKRIDLAKRAGQKRGWLEVEAVQYGAAVKKAVKTFLATYPPAGGLIRVVLVREEAGWIPLFSTDPKASVVQILEGAADRSTIEQDFHDLKEVEGAGQQQVRNIWANVGVFVLNLWAHTLIELWAWGKAKRELCDRSASPWDDAQRRPSHADRRKALQRQSIQQGFSTPTHRHPLPRKIRRLVQGLIRLVA